MLKIKLFSTRYVSRDTVWSLQTSYKCYIFNIIMIILPNYTYMYKLATVAQIRD